MVASTHWLASACGMSVLEAGGNAFDAAVAAGVVLQVVEPHLNGPGGEVAILLWDANDGATHVVCGQGVAPAAATIERFADLGLDVVPGTGLLAVTVPGAFGAWMLLLERWGTWRLRDVLAYAIGYSRSGFPALASVAHTLHTVRRLFVEDWPTSAAAWLGGGDVPAAGSRLRNPSLADTYERVVAEAESAGNGREGEIGAAVDAWYRGFVADAMVAFSSTTAWPDTSGQRHGGLLSADDLGSWSATAEAPSTFDYGPCTVCKTGMWGQGPVLLQQLALLSGVDLDGEGSRSPDFVHTVVESAKLAFADREAWYGDGADQHLLDHLLSPAYNDERRRLIGPRASAELRPGAPGGSRPRLARAGAIVPDAGQVGYGVGEPSVQASGLVQGDTCHVDVVDRYGNMVSATPSGGWLQSSPTIPELGFCLGTRAQMFWLEPGLANSLRPGARPRTTLSPSLVLQDGRPWMAFGTPGGDQQDQWGLTFLLSVLDGAGHGNLQTAIDAPTFHSEHFPSSFFPRAAHPRRVVVEDRVGPTVVAELRRRGHEVVESGPWSLGRLSAVAQDGDFLRAAANPRGSQGYAAGR